MPPAPSWARKRYSPITRGSSGASAFISAPRELVLALTFCGISPAAGPQRPGPQRGSSRLVAVTHAGFGEQVTRPGRVVLQLAAQPGHVEAEIVGALREAGTPHPGQDLCRRDQLAGTLEQDLQDPPLGGRQAQRLLRPGRGWPGRGWPGRGQTGLGWPA